MTKAQEKIYELEALDIILNAINSYKEDNERRIDFAKEQIKDCEDDSYDRKYYTSEIQICQTKIKTYEKVKTLIEKLI